MEPRNIVLQTKLQPPQIKGKILRRERLSNLLKENLDKKLTLICADAGYGKTTLLAQVCAELDKPFAFYASDASDNDLAAFFNYVVTGIQQHCPSFGSRTQRIVFHTRNIEILVGTFTNEFMEKIKEDFVIIVDDYHHFQQNKEIGAALDFLLRHMPANLHLIISSRSVPPLNLAYYFAKQELFKLEKEQLRFNLKEIQGLLQEVYGLKVPDIELNRIEQHSEGWITAIQLILQKISASGGEKAKETLNGYVASGEEVFSYFAGEVFGSQTKRIQEFLMKTSIIDDMDSETCNHLLKIRDAKRIFEYLETGHMFITRSNDYLYKYHPIFREFLDVELHRKIPAKRLSALHRRIAIFFEKKGLVELAAKHYMHSQDVQIAVELMLKNIAAYLDSGRIGVVENWLSSIPEKYYDRYPRLYIHRGHLLRLKGLFGEAQQMFNEARKNLKGTSSRRDLAKIWFELATISCMLGDTRKAYTELMKAKKICRRFDSNLRIAMSNCMAIIMYNSGKYKASEEHLLTGIRECERYRKSDKLSGLICNLGVLYSQRGDFNRAEECYARAIQLIEKGFFWIDMPLAYENVAGIKIIKGEYDRALELLRKGVDLAEAYQNQYSLCFIYLRLGMLHQAMGKLLESEEYFNKAIGIATDLNLKEVTIETQCALGDLYLSKGEPRTAREYFVSSVKLAGKSYDNNIQLNLFRGKIALVKKDYENALRIFKKVLLSARENTLHYTAAKCHLLLAKIYEKTGEIRKSTKSLKEGVRLTEEWGYGYLLQKELSGTLVKMAQKNGIPLPGIFQRPLIEARTGSSSCALQVNLFGNPVIILNGKPARNRWFTHKAKMLLCYFILHRNKPLTKEQVVEQLWPQCEFPKGENRFYFTLHAVRKALSGRERKAYERAVILYREQSYVLDPDITIDTDIARFEGCISQAKVLLSNNEKDKAATLLKKAIGLYQAPFCEGWYDNWVEEFRRCQENIYLKALSLLIDTDFESGLFEECINHCQKYLMIDKYNEAINCKLISSLLKIGARQQAISHYENFIKVLSKLNLTPIQVTTSLRKQLYP